MWYNMLYNMYACTQLMLIVCVRVCVCVIDF